MQQHRNDALPDLTSGEKAEPDRWLPEVVLQAGTQPETAEQAAGNRSKDRSTVCCDAGLRVRNEGRSRPKATRGSAAGRDAARARRSGIV